MRLAGRNLSSAVTVTCRRGKRNKVFRSYTRTKPGRYVLPLRPANPSACKLDATIISKGAATIELRAVV